MAVSVVLYRPYQYSKVSGCSIWVPPWPVSADEMLLIVGFSERQIDRPLKLAKHAPSAAVCVAIITSLTRYRREKTLFLSFEAC